MQSGPLDRRIRIERAVTAADAFNEPSQTWGELATVWASKRDVSDGERWQAQQIGATITTRFQIRWSSKVASVDERDRIVFDGRTYDITAVKEIGRRDGLEITASARAERT